MLAGRVVGRVRALRRYVEEPWLCSDNDGRPESVEYLLELLLLHLSGRLTTVIVLAAR
jgi:hypothetical protein